MAKTINAATSSNNNVSYHKMVRLLAHEIKCWYPSADLLLSHPAVLLSLDNSHNNADITEVPSFDLNSEMRFTFLCAGVSGRIPTFDFMSKKSKILT